MPVKPARSTSLALGEARAGGEGSATQSDLLFLQRVGDGVLSSFLRPCSLEVAGGPVSFLTSLGPSSERPPSPILGGRLGVLCTDRQSLRIPAPRHSNPIHLEK